MIVLFFTNLSTAGIHWGYVLENILEKFGCFHFDDGVFKQKQCEGITSF